MSLFLKLPKSHSSHLGVTMQIPGLQRLTSKGREVPWLAWPSGLSTGLWVERSLV